LFPDSFDIGSLPYGWLIAATVVVVAIGGLGYIGYLIATRRVRQPLLVFLGRFAITFLLLFGLEAVLLYLVPPVHDTMRSVTATLVGGILTVVGVEHTVSGAIITMQDPTLVFDVTAGCLGGLLFWTYVALVVAESQTGNRQRLTGIAVGLLILIAFNLLRITLSVYLQWLTAVRVHDVFYLVNIVVVLLVWAGWLRTLRRTGPPRLESELQGSSAIGEG
jgi:exosortase/archaeosortase family protein